MAVKDWSFARLIVVLTLGSAAALGLGLISVGAYLGAPADDPVVRFWEQNRWLLFVTCVVFVTSVAGLYALVAVWVIGRTRRGPGSPPGPPRRPDGEGPPDGGPSARRQPAPTEVRRPGLSVGMQIRTAGGGRLRWWEIAGLVAAVAAALWGRMHRRTISAQELGVVVAVVVLGVVIARPWRARGRGGA